MRVLELFSGTGSVGNKCKELEWEVISLDLKNADINTDILKWDYKNYPKGHFDIIWASPPCDTFSRLRDGWIGRKIKKHGDKIITKEILYEDIINEGLPILNKTKEIIEYFNPIYWFIENPQTSKMKEFNTELPFYDIDYCKYGFDYRKRTRIWTNLKNFEPKICKKDCNSIIVINVEGKKNRILHKSNCGNTEKLQAVRNADKNIKNFTTLNMRYRIPPLLIEELFECIIKDI
jgi:hypothetical protein